MVLLALALRLYGIEWGLPSDRHPNYSYHPDELPSLIWAAWLGQGKIISKHFMYGGTLYFTILDSLLFFTDFISGLFGGSNALAHAVLLGRCFMTGVAVLTIVMVYESGRRLFGKRAGLLAAILLSVSPASIVSAQQVRVDALAALGPLLILFLAARIPDAEGSRRLKAIILCGLAVGAATALRVPLVLCLVMPVAGFLPSTDTVRVWRSAVGPLLKQSVWLVGSALVGYLIASPHSFFYFAAFLNGGAMALPDRRVCRRV